MKELSIEEKAKRYDKALERAKKINIEHSKCGFKSSDDVLYIFPELVDEIIREEIIDFLRLPHPQFVGKRDHEKWIAWLEKQGEQKSVEEKIKVFIPKFRIGDVVKSISQPMLDSRIIISIDKDCYWTKGGGCIGFAWEKDYELIKQKPTAWSEEDEERYLSCLKILSTGNIEQPETVNTVWLKALKERVQPQPKQEWSEEDEDILNTIINHFEIDLECTENDDIIKWLKSLNPQPKQKWSEEDKRILSLLLNNYKQAVEHRPSSLTHVEVLDIYNFLKSLKDKGLPQRQEWSEDDENNLICIKRFLHEALLDTNKSKLIYLLDWLDAHYHQKQWKPSDGQLEALESATENCAYSEYQDCLRGLIEQLKKLKEE